MEITQHKHAPIGRLEQMAVWITRRVSTMMFFLLLCAWTIGWLGWNSLAPPRWQFDHPTAFEFWVFIANVIQLLLMPLILVGQAIEARLSEERSDHDDVVFARAETENDMMLQLLLRHEKILTAVAQKLDVSV
jgi:uncharacterized membrane protein